MYERIQELCKKRGISIKQVEEELGLGNGTISKWKTSTPKADTAQRVAEHLDVTVEYLVTGKNKDKKNPAPTIGDGMSEDEKEIIRLFRSVDPATRAAMLQLLRAAEAGQITQDVGEAK